MHPIRLAVPTLLLATLLAVPVGARDEPTLDQRLARLVERLEAERVAAHVPGLALAVVVDDEVVLTRGFGLADVEADRPVTPETLFAIGSSTKAFTATLVGMLADDGVLGWDDPVARHLPWFELQLRGGDAGAQVTLRDLLCHRTGFTRMSLLWAAAEVPRETILRTAARAEPWADFRREFLYNNVMYLAAGVASAQAAGKDWDALLRERLLEPLGMASSRSSVAAVREDPRLAVGYAWREGSQTWKRLEMRDLDAIGPAGAINSNAVDMARWVRFQLGRGALDGRRLIAEETLRETWEPQIEVGGGASYALGWMVHDRDGEPLVEHGGNIDGFSAQVALLPESGLGFALLANVSHTVLQQASLGIVLDALTEPWEEPGEVAEAALDYDELTGSYVADFTVFDDERFEVLVQNGRLAVDVPGQMVYELKDPDAEGKWYFALTDEIAVAFERDAEGEVVGMVMYQSGLTFELPLEGVEILPEVPLDELERYFGTFRDPALEADLTVLVKNNRLAVDVPEQMVYELHAPDDEGKWQLRISDQMAVRFNEEDGVVTSMTFFERGTVRELPRVAAADAKPLPTLEELARLRRPAERTAALAALDGLAARGTVRVAQAGVEGTITSWFGGSGRYRDDLDFGPFGGVRVSVVGDAAWSWDRVQGVQALDGAELAVARLQCPGATHGDWSLWFDEVSVLAAGEDPAGRGTVTLRLKREDLPAVKLTLDAATGDALVLETFLAQGPITLPVTIRMSEYRDVGGIRLPAVLESSNEATGRTIIRYEDFERGEPWPDATFVLRAPRGD